MADTGAAVADVGEGFSLEKMLTLIEENGVALAKAAAEKLEAEPMVSRPSRPRASEVPATANHTCRAYHRMQSRPHRRPVATVGAAGVPRGRQLRASAAALGPAAVAWAAHARTPRVLGVLACW